MRKFFTRRLLTGLTLAATLTTAHADESSQRCNAQRTEVFIGKYLTLAIKEQARVEARAAKVVVNLLDQQFETNRLQIVTDWQKKNYKPLLWLMPRWNPFPSPTKKARISRYGPFS